MRNALVGLLVLFSSLASADGLELKARTQERVSREIRKDSKIGKMYRLIEADVRRNPAKSAKLSEALNRWSETNSKESLESILLGKQMPEPERAGAPMAKVAEQKVDYQKSFYSYKAQTEGGKKFFEKLASSDGKSESAMREEIGRILHLVETKTLPNLKSDNERPRLAKASYLCAELWLTKFVPWGEENQKRSLEYLEQTLQGKPIFKREGAMEIPVDENYISGLLEILGSDPKDLKTDMLDVLTGRSVPEQKSQRDLLLDGFKSK